MVVNFYNNTSAEIVVNKELSTSKEVECVLKQDTDYLNPTLIFSFFDFSLYNYFYIPLFKRYYYVDNIYTREDNMMEVAGRVDVLMSFKDDILASTGIIERNENEFTKYIQDSKYTVLSYERVQTKVFPNSFPVDGQFILVVAGS